MPAKSTRIVWLDLVRTIAISLVVLCHATEAVYKLDLEHVTALSKISRVFCHFSFSCGRLGVPLFLMITGSLLLTRDYDADSIKLFWKEKWLHLLICTLIWFAIYDIVLILVSHESISGLRFFEEMIFFRKVGMNHVWFMPMILGVYILLPFVSFVLKNYDDRLFLFPFVIFAFYSFGFTTIKIIYRVYQPELPLDNQFDLGFSGGAYGLIILAGYFVKKGALKRIRTAIVLLVSLAFFVAVVCVQLWSYQKGVVYNVWYDNIFLFIACLGIFEICSRLTSMQNNRALTMIARYSFAIYLIHWIVRLLIADTIMATSFRKPVQVLLLWIICFAVSFCVSILISRIPKVGKYILYM